MSKKLESIKAHQALVDGKRLVHSNCFKASKGEIIFPSEYTPYVTINGVEYVDVKWLFGEEGEREMFKVERYEEKLGRGILVLDKPIEGLESGDFVTMDIFDGKEVA